VAWWGAFVNLVYGVPIAVVVALVTSLVSGWTRLSWFLAYAVAINVMAFVVYGYDKALVRLLGRLKLRVPEKILIWELAFPWGLVGSWTAMRAFHHKTGPDKHDFRFELLKASAIIVAVSAVFVFAAALDITSLSWLDVAVRTFVDLILAAINGFFLIVVGLVG
jgi:uncharacterized membrane protein YsdA (DUF1294 family)